jgi:DNA primase
MTTLFLLQELLGNYIQQRDECLFSCPFCHHPKKKLSINISTNKWKCWVCGSKGGHILWLLKKLNVPPHLIKEFKKILGDVDIKQYKNTTSEVTLHLPTEYIPLWKVDSDYKYKHAIKYLNNRGITADDILRYRIGYCAQGAYANRIILPSYDGDNNLNYFTARTFYDGGRKYWNPPVSKNIICFENMIDWSETVVLCEGMFDAISLRRNVIPLLGKTLPKKLELALVSNKVIDVVVFLDEDARLDAIKIQQKLSSYGINTNIVITEGKDASEMGNDLAQTQLTKARKADFKEFILEKMKK